MRFDAKDPPRRFTVGQISEIEIQDVADVFLEPNEQLTFVVDQSGARYDFVRKDWGFYATPSINGRLKNEGFKTALVENLQGRIYLMVVESKKMAHFKAYCQAEHQKVLRWLDEYPEKDNFVSHDI